MRNLIALTCHANPAVEFTPELNVIKKNKIYYRLLIIKDSEETSASFQSYAWISRWQARATAFALLLPIAAPAL